MFGFANLERIIMKNCWNTLHALNESAYREEVLTVLPPGIVVAAEHGDLEVVLGALDGSLEERKLKFRSGNGGRNEDCEMVHVRVDINSRSRFQSTLLLIASAHGHAQLVRELAMRGADLHALDYGNARRTALSHAIHRGHIEVVEALMEAGVDPCLRSVPDERKQRLQEIATANQIQRDRRYQMNGIRLENDVSAALRILLSGNSEWSPARHKIYPSRFKDAARLLILCAAHRAQCGTVQTYSIPNKSWDEVGKKVHEYPKKIEHHGSDEKTEGWKLGIDETIEVIRKMAYPLSTWFKK